MEVRTLSHTIGTYKPVDGTTEENQGDLGLVSGQTVFGRGDCLTLGDPQELRCHGKKRTMLPVLGQKSTFIAKDELGII